MDRALYVAMSGAKNNMIAQSIRANNLANVGTVGFRADFEQARAMPVYGDHYPSRVYGQTEIPSTDFRSGAMMTTGRDLDVAIKGEGWIAVVGADGQEGYTRAGDLKVDGIGNVTTGSGYQVLGNGGAVNIPPAEKIEIGSDGTISIRAVGQSADTITGVDRIKLVKIDPQDLVKGRDGLLYYMGDGTVDPDATVRIEHGTLESSNVNSVEEMTNIIALARQFELQVKAMKHIEDNDQAAARIMQMS